MPEFDNTNRGALFKNDRKQNDKDPTHRGTINVGGREYWLSGWLRESREGLAFVSLSVKAKDAPRAPTGRAKPAQHVPFNDEIGF